MPSVSVGSLRDVIAEGLVMKNSRRNLLFGLGAVAALPATSMASAAVGRGGPARLAPGQYFWSPERSPPGPVVVIVSTSDQLTFAYRNGVLIGVSSCSTGKPGHRTPTGVFTILQKRVEHYSNIYNNAPMPYMQRLTWRGIALHAGDLPGYPASAGCARLPTDFARKLFRITDVGTPVIVADRRSAPLEVASPGILLPDAAGEQASKVLASVQTRPPKNQWSTRVVPSIRSIVVSGRDRRAVVLLNGKIESEGEVRIREPEPPLGTQAFALLGLAPERRALRWMSYGVGGAATEGATVDHTTSETLGRIEMLDRAEAMRVAMSYRPGTTLVVTDLSASPASRTAPDFVVADGQPYRMPRTRPKAD
jgi:hypothetical protein